VKRQKIKVLNTDNYSFEYIVNDEEKKYRIVE